MFQELPSQRIARREVETIADTVLANTDKIRKFLMPMLYGVMGVSFFHQLPYLFKTFEVQGWWHLDTFDGYMHAVAMTVAALAVPLIFDGFTVACVMMISTVGLMLWVRLMALVLVAAPTWASGYVNFKASVGPDGKHSPVVATVFVTIVVFVALIEVLRAASHAIAYGAIKEREQTALLHAVGQDEVPGPVAPAKELDPMEDLVMRSGGDIERAKLLSTEYGLLNPGQKQSWSRRFNNTKGRLARELANPVAAAAATVQNAPVSPAGPRS